jgi:hypothetical protein
MLTAGGSMSSQPGAGDPPPFAGRSIASAYTPPEWRQLTRLPGQVVVAAIESSDGAGAPDRVAEAVAGLDGIASGRSFDSDLVRAVAADIYAETDRDAVEPEDPRIGVLAQCRAVARLLETRADPADAAAYRQWVQSIAARAGRAGNQPPRPVDQRFLAELGRALGLS